MRICVVGAGYVGLPLGACLADAGHAVVCVESSPRRRAALVETADGEDGAEAADFPREPGLAALVVAGRAAGRLSFVGSCAEAPDDVEAWFVCVGTPPDAHGRPALGEVFAAIDVLAPRLRAGALVVVKSTVPPGTTDALRERIDAALRARGAAFRAAVAFCPEFLRQGSAVADTRHPDRVVVGADEPAVAARAAAILRPFLRAGAEPMILSTRSAEMAK